MKALIVGKDLKEITKLVKGLDFEIVKDNPDLVISYGGDGTLIHAEREYPGIPKLPMRNSKVCKKCPLHEDKKVLQDFLAGKLKLKRYKKLHTNIYGKDLYALNEFVIRNELPIQAIRFRIHHMISPDLRIGDGVVISTPFGSTGYFQSITGETFTEGFALAFNNTAEKLGPIYINQDEINKHDDFTYFEFELVRGKAILAYDNNPDMYHLSVGAKLKFSLSDKVAKIYSYETMRCPNCQVIRD